MDALVLVLLVAIWAAANREGGAVWAALAVAVVLIAT